MTFCGGSTTTGRRRNGKPACRRRPSRPSPALVGGLFLAFCAPFWFVSTRAHPASFDVFLLLFSAWVLLRFTLDKTPALMYLFAFLYGLGITEFATFIVWAPVFGSLAAGGHVAGGPIARRLRSCAWPGCWMAGLLMYARRGRRVSRTPGL